jgi:hypothetical protein
VSAVKFLPAAAVDVILVLLFAIIGRRSHAEANDLVGVAQTAWPFLVGCLVGLLLVSRWRDPAGLRSGVVVWLSTVVLGLALRVLGGSTAQVSFIIVTTITLGVFLVGWRAVYRLVVRARGRRPDRAPVL